MMGPAVKGETSSRGAIPRVCSHIFDEVIENDYCTTAPLALSMRFEPLAGKEEEGSWDRCEGGVQLSTDLPGDSVRYAGPIPDLAGARDAGSWRVGMPATSLSHDSPLYPMIPLSIP